MLEFVTVFFSGDRILMKLQARSFRLFVAPEVVSVIHVVNNDEESGPARSAFESEVLHEYGDLAPKVVFHPWEEIISSKFKATGWRVQQALKLGVSRYVETKYYVAFDAKNHYIRHVARDDFFTADDDAKPIMFRGTPKGNLREYFKRTFEYLEQDPDRYIENAMPATTPYILMTDIVRRLIDYIEGREGIGFEEVMLSRNRHVTEFFLYYGFLLRSGLFPEDIYKFTKKRAVTLFTRWPEREEDLDRALSLLARPEYKMFGLHRNRVARMTGQQRQVIVDTWIDAGLVADGDEAAEFLRVPEAE